jgi:hypothetical protein
MLCQAQRTLLSEDAAALAGGLVDPNATIWSEFTVGSSTFYVGSTGVSQGNSSSAEECAMACLDQDTCLFWSWCPPSAAQG